jgi:hypothetical protein
MTTTKFSFGDDDDHPLAAAFTRGSSSLGSSSGGLLLVLSGTETRQSTNEAENGRNGVLYL